MRNMWALFADGVKHMVLFSIPVFVTKIGKQILTVPFLLNFYLKQDTSKKSPMELINEVPPIKVDGRIVACEGGFYILAALLQHYINYYF